MILSPALGIVESPAIPTKANSVVPCSDRNQNRSIAMVSICSFLTWEPLYNPVGLVSRKLT